MKKCRKCKEEKPLTEYHSAKTNRDGYKTMCKQCCYSEYRDKHAWKRRTPEARAYDRWMHIKRKFNLTQEEYTSLSDTQLHCAICSLEFQSTFDKQLDHCHTTGKIRKFLCQKCNKAIGLFNDNPEWLRFAASYIEENK